MHVADKYITVEIWNDENAQGKKIKECPQDFSGISEVTFSSYSHNQFWNSNIFPSLTQSVSVHRCQSHLLLEVQSLISMVLRRGIGLKKNETNLLLKQLYPGKRRENYDERITISDRICWFQQITSQMRT